MRILLSIFIVVAGTQLAQCAEKAVQENPYLASKWNDYRIIEPTEVSDVECKSERLKIIPINKNFQSVLDHAYRLFKDPRVIYFSKEDGSQTEEVRWGLRSDTLTRCTIVRAFFSMLKNRIEANLLPWCFLENNDRQFIGFIGAFQYVHINTFTDYNGGIELTWIIDPGDQEEGINKAPNWNKGYATEAMLSYIKTYIALLKNYTYLWISVHSKNQSSIKVAKKLGMVEWKLTTTELKSCPPYLKKEDCLYFRLDKKEAVASPSPLLK